MCAGYRVDLDTEVYEIFDILPSLNEALAWLRARIIAHRDELVRVTG